MGLKEVIKDLHDKYKPRAIFMTQTSSTLYGWAIKEAWKEAYPNEKTPTILTINTAPIQASYVHLEDKQFKKEEEKLAKQRVDEALPEFKDIKDEVEKKLKRHNINGNIAIIDEYRGTYETVGYDSRDHTKKQQIYEPKEGKKYARNSVSLGLAKKVIEVAKTDLDIKGKVVVAGLDYDRASGSPWTRYESGGRYVNGERQERLPHGQYKRKTESDYREYSKHRIKEFKERGREIGRELKREREQKKRNLEGLVALVVGIIGSLSSLLFLSSSITGNAIADLSVRSSSLIGTGLLAIGSVAGFFWLRNRNKKSSQ